MAGTLAADRTPESLERLHREVLEDVRRLRGVQVGLGRRLLSLRRADSFLRFGTTTFALYCEKVGLSAQEGREMAAMAEAAEVRPEVEARVADATISVQKAAAVAEVLRNPALQRPGEDWLRMAETHSSRELRDLLKERKEELALEEPPVALTLFVRRRARDAFGRCRELVSRSAGEFVTEGRAFEAVCDDFLERHDPERETVRFEERDREAKAGGNGQREGRHPTGAERRALPASVQRDVLRRFGDRCWVEGCESTGFLYYAHRRPVRDGGSNRPSNLLRLCLAHHRQFDGGAWWPVQRADGTVVLIDRRGVVVGRFRGISEAASPAASHAANRPAEPP